MSGALVGAYTFLPWVREGLAASITVQDAPGAELAEHVTLPVRLRVDGAGDVLRSVRLHGPGDVTGLHPSAILDTDPAPDTTAFEASRMPSVRFARADLPWLFTPAAADTAGRLRPWLVLVAVRRRPGVRLERDPGAPLPVLTIGSPAHPADELPDLAQSWAWAHAQLAGALAGRPPADVLRGAPSRVSSRIVCPRRLDPETPYLACVVPAFASGCVAAGLAAPVDEPSLQPAWTTDDPRDPLRLPVYHAWEFATGPAGDFETLTRRLRPCPLDPDAARPALLDLSDAGGGLPRLDPATPGAVVGLESALRVPGPDAPPPWPEETRVPFQQALEERLGTAPDTVAPPVYGSAQAAVDGLPAGAGPVWLRELNLDPRLRVAAAAGTRVVQQRQEQFMAEAWEQAGAVRDVNALLARSQLARELGGVLLDRHLRRLTPDAFLAVTQPAHAHVALAGRTVDAELGASRLPRATVSAAMRRLASPQGAVARRGTRAASGPLGLLAALERTTAVPAPASPSGMAALALSPPGDGEADGRRAVSAHSVRTRVLDRLRPEATVRDRVRLRVQAPDDTWQRPDALAPVHVRPDFAQPMYAGLRDVAPHLLLPGLAHVEPESVALLETSPRLIEAYMVGLNHELGRELLWREFPADPRATPLRRFWDVRGPGGEAAADIPPIDEWEDTPLGTHLRGGAGQLVLLVRGELLRRHPATAIYAAPATAGGGVDPGTRVAPTFRGVAPPDATFVGFPLTEEAVRGSDPPGPGWYVVFEEDAGAPSFGFDEAGPPAPETPDDLAWPHVPVTRSGHADVSRPLAGAADELQAAWSAGSAHIARLTLQKPFRVAIHAARLLGPPVPA